MSIVKYGKNIYDPYKRNDLLTEWTLIAASILPYSTLPL